MLSFDSKIAARGYHVYKNTTWKNAKAVQKLKVQVETNKSSKESDPYACAIKVKNNFSDNWMTVVHILREISSHCFYFIQEGASISGQLLSTNYKVPPIPAGGLEVPLLLTFSVIEDRNFSLMKDFVKNLYDYNYTGEHKSKDDEESDDDDEIEIVINKDKAEEGEEEDKEAKKNMPKEKNQAGVMTQIENSDEEINIETSNQTIVSQTVIEID